MEKNKYLAQAEKMLKKQKYHTYFPDENMLEVSRDKNSKPFAFLIIEKEQFPGIVLSLALDFHQTYIVADMTINLMHIAPLALGEPFYRSVNGTLYWDTAAQLYFEMEFNKEMLNNLEPVNDTLH